jgi:hypothetical protein
MLLHCIVIDVSTYHGAWSSQRDQRRPSGQEATTRYCVPGALG